MKCPACGQEMDLVDKTTFTGREVREYRCAPCDRTIIEHGGIALWQALSDARAEAERDAAEKARRAECGSKARPEAEC